MKKLCLFACVAAWLGCSRGDSEKKVAPLVEVRLETVKTADLTEQIRVPGTLFPLSQAAVAAKISAPIRELRVIKGSPVQKGQVVAVLENGDLEAARNEARSALQEAASSLARLSAGSLPVDIERAQAQLNIAQSALETAQKIYERRKTLVEQGAIPARELLVSQNELAAARNNHLLAETNLKLLQSQTRERDLEIARSKVEQARARLAQAEALLNFTHIRSPLNGVVTDQWMYPGDMAKPDAPIITVMDVSKMIVRAQAPEARAPSLSRGQAAEWLPQDLPDRHFRGRLSVISAAVDRAARTVEVWVEIDNPGHALRAGGYGTLSIAAGRVPGAVVISRAAAVMEEGSAEATVAVVDEKNIAHQRKIKVGFEQDGLLQVLEGLKPGEKVITEGNYGLPDNSE
ncbi:MAG: efflux RND transporter periplasmic adaptor subunit, partial [Acidobacteria bacterium]|nr:efflux RND transporter periplasmic adaptor subunit [Acidobacteriota bacterium]